MHAIGGSKQNEWDRKVPRVSCDELSLATFYDEYMVPNKPVIITGLVERWQAMEWVGPGGKVDTGKIKDKCGDSMVTVHNCSNEIKDMGRLETREMTVRDYLNWWEHRSGGDELLYLKDWNFCKEFPA